MFETPLFFCPLRCRSVARPIFPLFFTITVKHTYAHTFFYYFDKKVVLFKIFTVIFRYAMVYALPAKL